jgi:hypothetical protein
MREGTVSLLLRAITAVKKACPLECGTVQIFRNDHNKSKPDSGGNYKETELG